MKGQDAPASVSSVISNNRENCDENKTINSTNKQVHVDAYLVF